MKMNAEARRTAPRRCRGGAAARTRASTAAALTAFAVLSGDADAFQTSRPALNIAASPKWGSHGRSNSLGRSGAATTGPAHLGLVGSATRLAASTESDTARAASATPAGAEAPDLPRSGGDSSAVAKDVVEANNKKEEKKKGGFEPMGPAVVLDDPPTDVYNKAITRTLQWLAATSLFGVGLWSTVGAQTAEEFFAGYLVEQSLSVDNLFVFLLLFDYFAVPIKAQDRVLNWGIYGAVVMRAVMIGLGAAALENFHAILLVFAAILVYSSVKVLFPGDDEEEEDVSQNSIVKFSKGLIDSVDVFDGDRFFTLVDGVKKATPLFICMIAVELSDVVFAVDSIPAVFGVTNNPLVVFTSNIFAIMGLRSLYTILSKAASDLEYLEPAVAVVLGFIGAKMIAEYFGYHIATELALAVVATLLGGGVGLSVWAKGQTDDEEEEAEAE